MDSGKSELLKAWHTRPRSIGIESGIRSPASHAATTVTDVAIKRAGGNEHIARPVDLSLRRACGVSHSC
jgi:hypothetical protein